MATLVYNPGQTTNLDMGLGKFETRVKFLLNAGFSWTSTGWTRFIHCLTWLAACIFQLGDDVVTSGFTRELEHYQEKAEPRDQQKCAELLASLRFGDEIQRQDALLRRPKTAMAALGKCMFCYHFIGIGEPAKHVLNLVCKCGTYK